MHHDLKCNSKPYDAVVYGEKTFEFRKNDRNFKVGDTVTLFNFDDIHTGRSIGPLKITYILTEGYGLPDGYCIFSFVKGLR